jgi:hypothetical protein
MIFLLSMKEKRIIGIITVTKKERERNKTNETNLMDVYLFEST